MSKDYIFEPRPVYSSHTPNLFLGSYYIEDDFQADPSMWADPLEDAFVNNAGMKVGKDDNENFYLNDFSAEAVLMGTKKLDALEVIPQSPSWKWANYDNELQIPKDIADDDFESAAYERFMEAAVGYNSDDPYFLSVVNSFMDDGEDVDLWAEEADWNRIQTTVLWWKLYDQWMENEGIDFLTGYAEENYDWAVTHSYELGNIGYEMPEPDDDDYYWSMRQAENETLEKSWEIPFPDSLTETDKDFKLGKSKIWQEQGAFRYSRFGRDNSNPPLYDGLLLKLVDHKGHGKICDAKGCRKEMKVWGNTWNIPYYFCEDHYDEIQDRSDSWSAESRHGSYDKPITERQRYRIRKLGGRIDKSMNRSDASRYIKSLMVNPLHAENESHWMTFGRVDYNWATDPDDLELADEDFWVIDEHIRNEVRYEIDTNNLPGESNISSSDISLSLTEDDEDDFTIYYYWGSAKTTGVNSAEGFEAETLGKDSCCCGATKSKPCACMATGAKCSGSCACDSAAKKAESFEAEYIHIYDTTITEPEILKKLEGAGIKPTDYYWLTEDIFGLHINSSDADAFQEEFNKKDWTGLYAFDAHGGVRFKRAESFASEGPYSDYECGQCREYGDYNPGEAPAAEEECDSCGDSLCINCYTYDGGLCMSCDGFMSEDEPERVWTILIDDNDAYSETFVFNSKKSAINFREAAMDSEYLQQQDIGVYNIVEQQVINEEYPSDSDIADWLSVDCLKCGDDCGCDN